MAGVFGNTMLSGSMPSGYASYGYRMGMDAPASTASITPWLDKSADATNSMAKYHALFGFPNVPEGRDLYEGFPQDHYTMPKAFQGRNVYLEQVIITQISEDQQWPIKRALPLARNEKSLEIEWDQFIFNDDLLDRTPEEGVSRFLSSHSTGGSAAMLRMGIGLQWENGYLETPRGRLWFAMSLLQIANATIETCCAGAMMQLVTFDPANFPVFMLNNTVQTNTKAFVRALVEEEKQSFAILQQMPFGARVLFEQLMSRYRSRNGDGSPANLLAIGDGSSKFYEFSHPQEVEYSKTGRIGGPRVTTPGRLFQGIPTVESRAVLTGESDEKRDLFYSDYAIGDVFDTTFKYLAAMPVKDFQTYMMDALIFSSDADNYVQMSFEALVAASGLFVEDARGVGDDGGYADVGGHYSARLKPGNKRWQLTRLGRKFFGGSKTWGTFIKSTARQTNSIKSITEAIVRDAETLDSFRSRFFPGAPVALASASPAAFGGAPPQKPATGPTIRQVLAKYVKKPLSNGDFAVHHMAESMAIDFPDKVLDAPERANAAVMLDKVLAEGSGNNGDMAGLMDAAKAVFAFNSRFQSSGTTARVVVSPWPVDTGKNLLSEDARINPGLMAIVYHDGDPADAYDVLCAVVKGNTTDGEWTAMARKMLWPVGVTDAGAHTAHVTAVRGRLAVALGKGVNWAQSHFAGVVTAVYKDLFELFSSDKSAKPEDVKALNAARTIKAVQAYGSRTAPLDPALFDATVPAAGSASGHSFRMREQKRRDGIKDKDKKTDKYVQAFDDMPRAFSQIEKALRDAAPLLYEDAGVADGLNHFAVRHLAGLGGKLADNASASLNTKIVQSLFRNMQLMWEDIGKNRGPAVAQRMLLAVLESFFESKAKLDAYLKTGEGKRVSTTDFTDRAFGAIGTTDLERAAKTAMDSDEVGEDKARGDFKSGALEPEAKRAYRGDGLGLRGTTGYDSDKTGADLKAIGAKQIEYMLDNMPITDGEFVRWSLQNNIPPAFKMRGCRPNCVYEMGMAILMRGGGAAGNTFFGHQNVTVGDDAQRKMGVLHYTLYTKSLLINHSVVVHSFCCNSRAYKGGHGHEICNLLDAGHMRKQAAGERPGDIYPVPCYMDEETELEQIAEMTGVFAETLYQPGHATSFPAMQKAVAKAWGINGAADPRNRKMYCGSDTTSTNNTILCRAATYHFNYRTMQFDIETIANGHWGDKWYPRCVRVHNNLVGVPLENRRGPRQQPEGSAMVITVAK